MSTKTETAEPFKSFMLNQYLKPAHPDHDEKSLNLRMKITTEDLSVFYGEKPAIKNVSLSIPANSVTALIGPSGCGKSTFLRALNRMNDYILGARTDGKILYDGVNIYDRDIDVVELRRRVGMVFQRSTPFPKSVFDNVSYGPMVNGMKDKNLLANIVEESLKRAALWDEIKDRLQESALSLSGGQQQRVCIARSLAMNPEVVLMDEPASALDPMATAKIEELIHELKKSYTIVIVTHNMQQAARVSDFTTYFYLGDLIEYGPTHQIFTNPRKKETEDYITGRHG